ncbi:hypothetical protein EVAR_18042_1 [Eumeta japonica]|uniref:Uncharacterized protein n=1 Tax=Eumeta variegata TaxID=151549 RepID=A0A4C1XSK3_EUMVA|nr:hypothetical protein EVAR_18042_1 [Eumeta japonica]
MQNHQELAGPSVCRYGFRNNPIRDRHNESFTIIHTEKLDKDAHKVGYRTTSSSSLRNLKFVLYADAKRARPQNEGLTCARSGRIDTYKSRHNIKRLFHVPLKFITLCWKSREVNFLPGYCVYMKRVPAAGMIGEVAGTIGEVAATIEEVEVIFDVEVFAFENVIDLLR